MIAWIVKMNARDNPQNNTILNAVRWNNSPCTVKVRGHSFVNAAIPIKLTTFSLNLVHISSFLFSTLEWNRWFSSFICVLPCVSFSRWWCRAPNRWETGATCSLASFVQVAANAQHTQTCLQHDTLWGGRSDECVR